MKPRLGRYKLLRKLAQGGMAQVYLARQSGADGFSKKVVIKRVQRGGPDDPAFNEMFLSEAVLAAQLNHPNVVHVYDFAEANGERFIVMEYVDGPSLKALIKLAQKANRVLPITHCLKIASWACEGLAYAHDLKHERTGEPLQVVHRDITPDNILITRTGVVKIIDFGIAKAATQVHQTQPGEMKGKLAYVSPEQLRGEPLDGRADLFSLAVVLYEALTTTQPFSRDNPAATMEAVVRAELPPLSSLRPEAPAGLDALLAKATAKRRDDRFANALEFQAALEAEIALLMPNFAPARLRELVQVLDPAPPYEEEDTTTADSLALPTPAAESDDVHTDVFMTGPLPAVGRATTKTSPRIGTPPLPYELPSGPPRPAVVAAPMPELEPEPRTAPGLVPMAQPAADRPRLPVLPLLGLMLVTGVASWFISGMVSRPDEAPVQPIVVTLRPEPPPPPAPTPEVPVADPEPEPLPLPLPPPVVEIVDAGTGVRVSLKSTPAATVWVDGVRAGEVPVELQLEAGSHRLRFDSADAGLNKSVLLKVTPGQSIDREFVFERSRLTLEAPEGATVFLGKKKLGVAPLEPLELYEGTYRIRAVAQDQNLDVTKVIELKPGDVTERLGPD